VEEKILALRAKANAARETMEKSLLAASADGVSDEDKAKHLAEFDAAELVEKSAKADLDRFLRFQEANEHAAAFERAPIVSSLSSAHRPERMHAGTKIPANIRRKAKLEAFSGPDAEEAAYQAGLWIAATQYGHNPSKRAFEDRYGKIKATLSDSSNTGAAYFVPDRVDLEIVKLTEMYGVFRQYAKGKAMDSDTLWVPRWTGAMLAYWVAEGQSPTQSEQKYDGVQLVAKNLATFGKISAQLSEDSLIDLGDEWTKTAAIAFAYAEDNAAFNGDGSSTYGGITGILPKLLQSGNAASLVSAAATHITAAQVTLADLENVPATYPNYPGANPVWFCHKSVFWNVMVPLQLAGNRTAPQDIANGGIMKFLGTDVVFTNVLPKSSALTNSSIGLIYGDLSLGAFIGDRRERKFQSGMINDDMIKQLMTLFMASRVDVNIHTLTDPKDSTKPGPILGFQLAAS